MSGANRCTSTYISTKSTNKAEGANSSTLIYKAISLRMVNEQGEITNLTKKMSSHCFYKGNRGYQQICMQLSPLMEQMTIESKLGVKQDQHAPRVTQMVFEDKLEGRQDQLTPKGVVIVIIKNKPLSIMNQLISKSGTSSY